MSSAVVRSSEQRGGGAAGRLELGTVGDQRRYHLVGRAVENGDTVELLVEGGTWLRGVFYWSGSPARWPGLRVVLGALPDDPPGEASNAVLSMPPAAVLRWAR